MGLTFQKLHCNQSVYIESISIKNNKTCKLWQIYMKYYTPVRVIAFPEIDYG
jgi:hypothetical protein